MKYISMTLVLALFAAGCGSTGSDADVGEQTASTTTTVADASTTTTVADAPELSDAEVVWCDDLDNLPSVGMAAISLQLEGSYLLDGERRIHLDKIGSVNDLLFGGFVVDIWKPAYGASFVRACKAAFESH